MASPLAPAQVRTGSNLEQRAVDIEEQSPQRIERRRHDSASVNEASLCIAHFSAAGAYAKRLI